MINMRSLNFSCDFSAADVDLCTQSPVYSLTYPLSFRPGNCLTETFAIMCFTGMKRGADKEMGSPLKRARNLGHELRILIPSRVSEVHTIKASFQYS